MTDLPKPDNARDAERLRQAMVWTMQNLFNYPADTYPAGIPIDLALRALPDPVTPTMPRKLNIEWATCYNTKRGIGIESRYEYRDEACEAAGRSDRTFVVRLAVVEVVEPAKPEPRVVEGPSGYHYRVVHGTAEFRAPAGGDRWFPVGPICLEDAVDEKVHALLREVSK